MEANRDLNIFQKNIKAKKLKFISPSCSLPIEISEIVRDLDDIDNLKKSTLKEQQNAKAEERSQL